MYVPGASGRVRGPGRQAGAPDADASPLPPSRQAQPPSTRLPPPSTHPQLVLQEVALAVGQQVRLGQVPRLPRQRGALLAPQPRAAQQAHGHAHAAGRPCKRVPAPRQQRAGRGGRGGRGGRCCGVKRAAEARQRPAAVGGGGAPRARGAAQRAGPAAAAAGARAAQQAGPSVGGRPAWHGAGPAVRVGQHRRAPVCANVRHLCKAGDTWRKAEGPKAEAARLRIACWAASAAASRSWSSCGPSGGRARRLQSSAAGRAGGWGVCQSRHLRHACASHPARMPATRGAPLACWRRGLAATPSAARG